jgi:glycosyltransferase involved in cell wall biosynthesis
MKKLVILSHTEHYRNGSNQIVGWGSTVNEINFLADYWEEVVHVGCFYADKAPSSALPYSKNTIRFEAIPPYGGKSLIDKIKIFTKIPKIIAVVYKNIKGATEVQLRLPTSMGLFLLPLFRFVFPRNYTFWVKYAGNWGQENPPLSYRIQRWWLQQNFAKCKVTINGFWEKQPRHCLSFENPCLTENQIAKGLQIAEQKKFDAPFVFTFVGRLEEAKGVSDCIDALRSIPIENIEKVHFIGDGEKIEFYKDKVSFLGDKVIFHGFLESDKVHSILATSHFLLLPSKSEGFPKVIAEAACYGVVPVVSNVGSISHYINESNGFLWTFSGVENYAEVLLKAIGTDNEDIKEKSLAVQKIAEKFTFTTYVENLFNRVF